MNGPEHYAEAERLLGTVPSVLTSPQIPVADRYPGAAQIVAQAQVHATLALTAATAQAAFDPEGRALVPQGGIIRVGWETVL